MKRALITGAGGFMGSHVMRHLLENTDWELVLTDSFRHKGKTDRITVQLEGLDATRVTVITHDLKAPISEQMAARIGHVDYVLHIASESHVDRSIDEPREFIENNVAVTLTMLEYIRKYPVEKFIQISTDEVFGSAPEGYAHKEGDPHKPSNPYSASKAAQEDICYAYWRTYGLPIFISNTMNVVGEFQDPEKYVPKMIKSITSGEPVTVHAQPVEDHWKPGTRFYLHARNQADALLYILSNMPVVKYGEGELPRYNVVGEREVNNLELALLVSEYVGKDLVYKFEDFHGSRPGHDLRYALDGTKLASAGWKAPIPLEDSLRKTVEWEMEHPEWLL